MSIGIKGISIANNAHIDDAINAECQSADGKNQTYCAQYC